MTPSYLNNWEVDGFECQCLDRSHALRFDHWPGSGEISASIHLDPHARFFKRLIVGINYIIGFRARFGHFGCWLLRPEDYSRLMDLLNRVQQEQGEGGTR